MKSIKVLVVADTHGDNVMWAFEDYNKYDKIVFLGDYVDSFTLDDNIILNNLNEIIKLKKNNPNKFILLWGNHDVHYLFKGKYKSSGYRDSMENNLYNIFNENIDLFQLSYQIKNYLFIHAGVHRGWYNLWIKDKNKNLENETLSETLNRLFDEHYEPIFHCGVWRGGQHKVGGPLWLDKNEMGRKPIIGYHQIVGHNQLKKRKIQHTDFKNDTSITYCDTGNYENYELIIKI